MASKRSIWDRPVRSTPTTPLKPPVSQVTEPPPPVAPPVEPPPSPRRQPPKKTKRRTPHKSSPKSRTHVVTFSVSKEEHKLFKAKTREMKTSFSALVRTALYHYLDIDPLERPK